MNKIEKAYSKLKDIYNLNSGGCLIAAYAVYKKLINDSNIRIVQFGFDIENNKEFISGNRKQATSSIHFAITDDFGKTFYDSNGIYNKYNTFYIIPRHKTYAFCKSALLDSKWNSSFNRDIYVPIIFKKLKISIKFLKH